MEEKKYIQPFAESVLDKTYDVSVDFCELGLDAIIESICASPLPEIVKDIPIVKNVVCLGRVGIDAINTIRLKKQLTFINALRREQCDQKELERRKKALANGDKWIFKEIESLYIYLERCSGYEKARLHAKIYATLLNNEITYDDFYEFLQIIDMLFLEDLDQLKRIHEQDSNYIESKCCRLLSVGVLNGLISMYPGTSRIDKFEITDIGNKLYSVLFKEDTTILE